MAQDSERKWGCSGRCALPLHLYHLFVEDEDFLCKFLCFECHLLQMDTKPTAELPVDVSEITLWEVPS